MKQTEVVLFFTPVHALIIDILMGTLGFIWWMPTLLLGSNPLGMGGHLTISLSEIPNLACPKGCKTLLLTSEVVSNSNFDW